MINRALRRKLRRAYLSELIRACHRCDGPESEPKGIHTI